MNWLPAMMLLSCRLLSLDEAHLKRAERMTTRHMTQCVGARSCAKYLEALTDIHDRMEARTIAWTAKECGGPMENT